MLVQICIDALIIIAAVVTFKQARREPCWVWIIAYWAVLTIKNILDRANLKGEWFRGYISGLSRKSK